MTGEGRDKFYEKTYNFANDANGSGFACILR